MGTIMTLRHGAHDARQPVTRPHPRLHLAARALIAGLLLLISGVALAG